MTKRYLKPKNEYQKIPVSPDVYAEVRMIAEANGFGERGLGAQIAAWVKKEVPTCGHKKQAVDIEYAPASDRLEKMVRTGWYCSTCHRVYATSAVAVEAVPA